jgi:hypothetical protein
MTTGRFASRYRWGTEETRIEEEVVTDTSLPLRIGVKTDNKGSALCLMVCIYRRSVGKCNSNSTSSL